MKALIVVALLSLLAGCSGEGDGGDEVAMPDDEVMALASDQRVIRLSGIVERTEILLIPGVHVQYSVSAVGVETTTDSVFQDVSCEATACTATGITLDLASTLLTDLIDPDVGISVSEADLRSRQDGFDTAFVRGDLDASVIGALFPDITLVDIPEALAYGLWGRHGMAGLVIADGPFSGRTGSIPFSGDMEAAMPFAFGDVSGTSPGGSGKAVWSGIAEVVALRTFRRQEGSATLTIADLAQPAVTVGIEVGGNPIGKAGWTDLPLSGGRFMFGSTGDDYLEGSFHGPDHGEAYGVFDTENFTGAFGATRNAQGE